MKPLVRYRVGLGVAVAVLVTATVAAVSWATFLNTRAALLSLTGERVAELLRGLGERVDAHMTRAVPAAELSRMLVRDALLPGDADALARHFVLVLRANPSLSWASYSDEAGRFTGAYRSPRGDVRVSQSTVTPVSELREHTVGDDGRWTPSLRQQNYGYDPRVDRFYEAARAAGRRVWIGPYVFFDEGVPGITCATPLFEPDGRLRGVFTADFNLNFLSRFVAALPFGTHGRVFVLTPDGTVVAHPTLRLVEVTGQGSKGKLVTADDVGDPVLQAFVRTWKTAARAAAGDGQFSFDHGGERYLAGYRVVEIDGGLRWVLGAVAPEADFLGVLARNRLIALAIMAVALGAGVAVTLVLARRISAPLGRLADEMEEIGRYQLAERPRLRTIFKEVALMDGALQTMKGGLRSFSYYVPTELVRAVLASGQEAKLEGHTREMTVYFSDIAGFTSTAETLTPEELVQQIGRYFDEMTRVIAASGGTIDKFIGDAIMAFWGAPVPVDDHAARACEAAVRSQRLLAQMRAAAATPWLAALHARVGIATGDALVGNIGTPARFNYTVMGDTVNLASRLESLNKLYGTSILVSEATYRAARERVIGRAVDVVQVKGKHRGVRVYEPLALASDADAAARALAADSDAALDRYLARDFRAAAEGFERILREHAGDRPAKMLLDRCREFLVTPPPERWDGVYVARDK